MSEQFENDDRSIGAPVSPGGFNSAGELGIEIRGFSLAKAVLGVGLFLTVSSFADFFLNDGGGQTGLSSLGFIYGIPVSLIGCALQYAELEPAGAAAAAAGEERPASAHAPASAEQVVLIPVLPTPSSRRFVRED